MKKRFLVLLTFLASCGVSEVELIQGPPGSNGHSLASFVADIPAGVLCANGGRSLDIYVDMDDSLSVTEGDKFSNSLIGCAGLNGLSGLNGVAGATGQTGQQGLQGISGAQGPQGLQGPQGEQGEGCTELTLKPHHDDDEEDDSESSYCQAGPAGPAGSQGEQGPQGLPGTSGAPGAQGIAGIPGLQGIQGEKGEPGASGTSVTITSYTSSSCTLIAGSNPSYYAKSGSLYSTSSCSSSSRVSLQVGESVWIAAKLLATYDGSGLRVINFN